MKKAKLLFIMQCRLIKKKYIQYNSKCLNVLIECDANPLYEDKYGLNSLHYSSLDVDY